MVNKTVSFEIFMEEETETTYELRYGKESYLIFAKHDGKFHNKLYECEKEIPEELQWFVDSCIREDLKSK